MTSDPASPTPDAARSARRRPRRTVRVIAAIAIVLLLALGACEALGWPFLAAPMQQWIAKALDRQVVFGADAQNPRVAVRLLGSIRVDAAQIVIGAPRWSTEPHMLKARDARLTLGYADLWRASRGGPLRIRALRAAELDGRLERQADGQASWQFGQAATTPEAPTQPPQLPEFGLLQVDAGRVTYRDVPLAADLEADFSLIEGATPASSSFELNGQGRYRQMPLTARLKTSGVLPVVTEQAVSVPVFLDARVGGASVHFEGTATDALNLGALKGRYTVQGPSLAAVGDPLRVTLPTTGPFRAQGLIAKEGVVWHVVSEQLQIGSSRLGGSFTYDPRPRVPLLSGRLSGARLQLVDLGPAVGTRAPQAPETPKVDAAKADAEKVQTAKAPGRVLPNRPFDLPALRAMDANVLVDIDNLDLGSSFLEPLKPLRTHLVLADGVLTLRELDARTGQGQLAGMVRLDGRDAQALWTADLRWSGVRLESWIHQARADNAPPYASGRLSGQARVTGQGKSTAAILGSLRGGVRMQLVDGSISHLAVEAAGLDLAQGLGILIKGDDALPVQCSAADLVVDQGLLRPRVLVLDTRDSTLWIDGSLSLASEALDLRVVVTPKDFSPLALRTPVHLRGTFANPQVGLDKGKLGTRVGAALLLGAINPLAALIPLVDVGNGDDAKRGSDDCATLSRRLAQNPKLAAPRLK